jgi:hypothetical protein
VEIKAAARIQPVAPAVKLLIRLLHPVISVLIGKV